VAGNSYSVPEFSRIFSAKVASHSGASSIILGDYGAPDGSARGSRIALVSPDFLRVAEVHHGLVLDMFHMSMYASCVQCGPALLKEKPMVLDYGLRAEDPAHGKAIAPCITDPSRGVLRPTNGAEDMGSEFLKVENDGRIIRLYGDLRLNTLDGVHSALHQAVVIARYRDVTIDLSNLSTITCSVIAPFAAYLRYLTRDNAVDFSLWEPRNTSVRNRVIRLGLAHYIDYRRYEKPRLKSSDPALIQFLDHDEREVATDKVINSALRTAKLERQHVAALEWAVNEITDNVLTHSNSKVGGFLISYRLPNSNIIEFTVADAGIGIARSLGIPNESEAVEQAIQEGVTKNKTTNQGNGLYGTYRLALASSGVFVIKSRHGNLYVTRDGDMHVRRDPVPFVGTFVVCQVDCDRPDLIERAFVFGGRSHVPAYDYIEKKHENSDQNLNVRAIDICNTFGSRRSGQEARQYISNLIGTLNGGMLKIDFDGISVISSSFADEVFGKLFVELGPMRFMRTVEIINAVSAVEGLIDRAITLRSKTGL